MVNELLYLLLFVGSYVGLFFGGAVKCNKTDSKDVLLDNSMQSEIGAVDSKNKDSLLIVDYEEGTWPNSTENGDNGNLSHPAPSGIYRGESNLSDTCLENARRMNLLTKNENDCGGILVPVVHSTGRILATSSLKDCKWLVCNDYGMYFRFLVWEPIGECDKYYVNVCVGCRFSENGNQLEKGTRHKFCGMPRRSEFVSSNQVIVIEVKIGSQFVNWLIAVYQLLKRKLDCVPTSNDENGVITSPDYSDSHPEWMLCTRKIRAPQEHRIIISISDFSMISHEELDFLQIWDGTYEEYPMITRYDVDTPPPPTFVSNSNSVRISSYTECCSKIKLVWKFLPFVCNETLRVSSGTISTPSFRKFDKLGLYCNWKIIVNPGNIIRLMFLEFWITTQRTTCDEDYVEIANIDENGFSKVRYCETRKSIGAIYTTSNKVAITMVMFPRLGADKTFRIRFEAVCTTTVVGYKGTIESINYPHILPPHINCLWTINAPDHGSVFVNLTHVNIRFEDFQIFEPGVDGASDKIGCFLVHTEFRRLGARTCLSRGKTVLVELKSSSEIFKTGTGFRLEWEIHGCVGNIRNTSGIFQSPGYPNRYPISTVCEWTISTESGSGVELTIHDWNIENSTDCKFDGLKVFTLPSHASQPILHLCGSSQYPSILTSQLNRMYIQFYSDESLSFKGFNASFKQITTSKEGNCGDDHFGPTGFIYSPNFPKLYNNLDNCHWTITAHHNFLAALNILELDIEYSKRFDDCRFDNLTIYYDRLTTGPPDKVLCGKLVSTNVVSSSNVMTLTFQTDHGVVLKGFKSTFFQACGARLNRDRGIIQSPDFLSMMNGAGNCSWTITSSTFETRVILLFTDFYWSVTDPDCGQHYIEVLDKSRENTTLHKGCCSYMPPVTISSGNVLTLRTKNAEKLVFKAFYFSLTEDCLRILRKTRPPTMAMSIGNLSTANSEATCQQTLHATTDNQQTVNVQFQLYQYQLHGNICNTNFVGIHDKDFLAPPTKFFCLQAIPTLEDVSIYFWTVYIMLDASSESGGGLSTDKKMDLNWTNIHRENDLVLSGAAAQNGKRNMVCMLLLWLTLG